jgi:hypothetical protein
VPEGLTMVGARGRHLAFNWPYYCGVEPQTVTVTGHANVLLLTGNIKLMAS